MTPTKSESGSAEIKPLKVSQKELDAYPFSDCQVEPGYRSIQDWCEIWGMAERTVSRALSILVQEKKMTKKNYLIGRRTRVFYKVV